MQESHKKNCVLLELERVKVYNFRVPWMNRERCDWWLIIAVDAIYTTSRVPLKVHFPKPFPSTPAPAPPLPTTLTPPLPLKVSLCYILQLCTLSMSVLLRVLTIKRNKAAYQMRGDVNINCGSLGLIRWQLWEPNFCITICPPYMPAPPRGRNDI